MNYKTNANLFCHHLSNGNLYISVAGTEGYEYKENTEFYLVLIKEIQKKTTNLQAALVAQGYDISPEELENLLSQWQKMNILKPSGTVDKEIEEKNFKKYDRQIKNFGTLPQFNDADGLAFQSEIENSVISVIGVGGVGSYISYGLAAMGFGEIRIIDGDAIELSNTSRQILYLEKDVGKRKVDVAEEKLKEIAPNATIKKKNIFLSTGNMKEVSEFISGSDLIIQCADTPRGTIEYIVDDISRLTQTPWITFAPFNFSKFFVGPLIIPGKTKQLSELLPRENIIENTLVNDVNSRFNPTIMDPYNGIAAKAALIEVVKFITGYKKPSVINSRLIVDTENWTIEKYDF